MAISSFPNGFANGVTVRGVPLLMAYPNKIFWVDSTTGSNGNKGTFDRPFATIDYAIGRCTANKGDIIAVKAGHTETVSTASGIDFDVAGVAVIGFGVGSLRPTINISAIAGFVDFSAANCFLMNVLITGGIDAVVKAVLIDAADCTLEAVEIRDVTGQVTDGILTTANADRAKILKYRHNGATAAGTNAGIAIVGGNDIEITIDRMDGNFAVGGIDIRTTATTNLLVRDVSYFRTRNAADIFIVDTITGSTGQIGPNIYLRLNDNAANITESCTGATFVYHQPISVVNNAGEVGMNINITASTDA
jgi:hypothetical protein